MYSLLIHTIIEISVYNFKSIRMGAHFDYSLCENVYPDDIFTIYLMTPLQLY